MSEINENNIISISLILLLLRILSLPHIIQFIGSGKTTIGENHNHIVVI